MVPLAMNVWQSMDVTTEWIATMIFFGGGLLLFFVIVMNSRVYRLLKAQREGNWLLREIIKQNASRGAEAPPTLPAAQPQPPPPPLPKTEPDVYKL